MCNIKDIEKKAHEIKEFQRMKEEIESEIEALKNEIKAEMTALKTDNLTAGVYKISYIPVIGTRVDTTLLKKELPKVAAQYTKETRSMRFSIT